MFENVDPFTVAIIVMVYSLIADFTFRPILVDRRIQATLRDPETGRAVVVSLFLGLAELVTDPGEREVLGAILKRVVATIKGIPGAGGIGWAPRNLKEAIGYGLADRFGLLGRRGATEAPSDEELHEGPHEGRAPPRERRGASGRGQLTREGRLAALRGRK